MEWILLFVIGSSCYVIFKFIVNYFESDGTKFSNKIRLTLGWAIFLLAYGSYFYYEETTSIKDEKIYYVNLFEKVDGQKNYRVPAKIYKDEDGYKLSEIYWSNGGKLTFYNDYGDLKLGEKVQVTDDKNKDWYAELTKNEVKTK